MGARSANAMVQRCFRHQHPEAYGRPAAAESQIPPELRYGRGEVFTAGPAIGEESMGDPDHYSLDAWGQPTIPLAGQTDEPMVVLP